MAHLLLASLHNDTSWVTSVYVGQLKQILLDVGEVVCYSEDAHNELWSHTDRSIVVCGVNRIPRVGLGGCLSSDGTGKTLSWATLLILSSCLYTILRRPWSVLQMFRVCIHTHIKMNSYQTAVNCFKITVLTVEVSGCIQNMVYHNTRSCIYWQSRTTYLFYTTSLNTTLFHTTICSHDCTSSIKS